MESREFNEGDRVLVVTNPAGSRARSYVRDTIKKRYKTGKVILAADPDRRQWRQTGVSASVSSRYSRHIVTIHHETPELVNEIVREQQVQRRARMLHELGVRLQHLAIRDPAEAERVWLGLPERIAAITLREGGS